MNRDAVDLWEFFFYAVLQRGRYVVDLGNRQRPSHRAMAGSEDVVFHLSHAHVVAIYELVEFRSQGVQKILDRSGELFHLAGASVGRGDVAAERLDMDIHVR